METVTDFIFLGLKSLWMVTAAMKLKEACFLEKKSPNKPRQYTKKQRHHFTNKGLYNQSYGFPSSHVWIWELNNKESWVPKNWCFWIVVLEKLFWVPLPARRLNQSILRNQHWVLIGRSDAEAEGPILWPPDGKNWLIGKDFDAGKD